MHRYYKIIMVPTVIILMAVMFSGVVNSGKQSHEVIAKNLLKERTGILQNYYYGKLEKDEAITRLKKIETYPLLTKDTQALDVEDGCKYDTVRSMEITNMTKTSKLLHLVSFEADINWDMTNIYGDYTSNDTYSVVMKSTDKSYKLSEFNIK